MLLKEVFYSREFLNIICKTFIAVSENFDSSGFLKNLPPEEWEKKELKQRMRAIALAINEALPEISYRQKIHLLKQLAIKIPKDKNSQFALIIFADFVEVFGGDDFNFSMNALEFFTKFGSAEFAVRKFIKSNQAAALKFFKNWSQSKNYHTRRLASEGLRPRLPWGDAIDEFKKNPSAILPILENLKFDKSEYVRRSLANNFNDISKDNPELVLQILHRWKNEMVSEKLIKHALRTLLKNGNEEALSLVGINTDNISQNFTISSFLLEKSKIKIGEDLNFGFTLENQIPGKKFRLEYLIHFFKKNSTYRKKIFQIATKNFGQNSFQFRKKHSFRNLTTRKHYAGKHFISLIINGKELQKLQFDLT